MKTKTLHTPEPSTYEQDFPTIIILSDGYRERIEWRSSLDVESTKNLYRAAPDLLEAAKRMDLSCLCDPLNPCSLSKTDKHWGGGDKCGPCKMVAAIAKATGQGER